MVFVPALTSINWKTNIFKILHTRSYSSLQSTLLVSGVLRMQLFTAFTVCEEASVKGKSMIINARILEWLPNVAVNSLYTLFVSPGWILSRLLQLPYQFLSVLQPGGWGWISGSQSPRGRMGLSQDLHIGSLPLMPAHRIPGCLPSTNLLRKRGRKDFFSPWGKGSWVLKNKNIIWKVIKMQILRFHLPKMLTQ